MAPITLDMNSFTKFHKLGELKFRLLIQTWIQMCHIVLPLAAIFITPSIPKESVALQPAISPLGKDVFSCRRLATQVVALRLSSVRNPLLVKVTDRPRISMGIMNLSMHNLPADWRHEYSLIGMSNQNSPGASMVFDPLIKLGNE